MDLVRMRLSLFGLICAASLTPTSAFTQEYERVEQRSGAWQQIGGKNPMTDVVTWLPIVWTFNLESPSNAQLLSDDARLNVSCQNASQPLITFDFSYNQPLTGVFIREGDSLSAQFRFGTEPPLPPTWLINRPDTSSSSVLQLPTSERAKFLAGFRRANRVLLRVSDGYDVQNYYFSLNGFSAMWNHCRRHWAALQAREGR
jgi:hypothetical protein